MKIAAYECECKGCGQLMQYDLESLARRFRYFHRSGCNSSVVIRDIHDKIYQDVPLVEDKIPLAKNEGYAN